MLRQVKNPVSLGSCVCVCVCQVLMKSFTFLLIVYRELYLVNDVVVSQI